MVIFPSLLILSESMVIWICVFIKFKKNYQLITTQVLLYISITITAYWTAVKLLCLNMRCCVILIVYKYMYMLLAPHTFNLLNIIAKQSNFGPQTVMDRYVCTSVFWFIYA